MKLNEAIALIDGAVPYLQRAGQPRAGRPLHWADLGCGTGLFTEALARILPAGSILYGVDTHPGLPTAAQLRPALPTGSQLHPITADFEKDDLPLKDLDGILMANSLHYIKNKATLIKKLQTYMLPNAPFIIIEYDTDTPVARWVPYPMSFASMKKLFPSAQKLAQHPSVYGRANIYAAIATATRSAVG